MKMISSSPRPPHSSRTQGDAAAWALCACLVLGCGNSSKPGSESSSAGASNSASSSAGAGGASGGSTSAPGAGASAGGRLGGDSGSPAGEGGSPDPIDAGGSTEDAALPELDPFSFFVTSIEALRTLSGNEKGFGGDLRFGEADGLSGADEICRQIAESSMPGAGQKPWRAFLSATAGAPGGGPVHAIERIGGGPWYDRIGRLVAMNPEDLVESRPEGADPAIINDLPNELGVPNGHPIPGGERVDNHHMLTGSDGEGRLFNDEPGDTCNDWTSSEGPTGTPRCGVAWPRSPGDSWISLVNEGGCAPGFNLIDSAPPAPGDEQAVGANGGYGGFYCFSLIP